ncbi:MAG: hypothetical protein IPO87_07430 [Flavobacteriales bacterium]|nr:hypothetical protein [Flavobacteriales bacterium]
MLKPRATAQGGVLNCNVSSIMLVGTGNGTFAWSGPNGFSSTVQNPNVGAAGTYNLGCYRSERLHKQRFH